MPSISHVIIDFTKASGLDTTALGVFIDMTDQLLQDGINVLFVMVNIKYIIYISENEQQYLIKLEINQHFILLQVENLLYNIYFFLDV